MFYINHCSVTVTDMNSIQGALIRNRDLFHIWAIRNIFQPRLLEEVLVKLTEQTENVIEILQNAEKSKCINSELSLSSPIGSTEAANFAFLQKNDQFQEVLKETLQVYIAQNTEDRCIRKLDIFKHKSKLTTIFSKESKFQSTRQLAQSKKP